jgi:hypothetical protein
MQTAMGYSRGASIESQTILTCAMQNAHAKYSSYAANDAAIALIEELANADRQYACTSSNAMLRANLIILNND